MALNTSQLAAQIKAAFDAAQAATKAEGESTEQFMQRVGKLVADGIAAAVDTYVRAAEVKGVTVAVTAPGNQPVGTGTQTGAVKLQ